ncbi:hypothetical protein ABZ069_37605 [Streptomyces microflavus]|uniref:hypothetical protein n=1 Tax=Streptomyces microflavus TaxID=1919 RepID=UPI0033B7846C
MKNGNSLARIKRDLSVSKDAMQSAPALPPRAQTEEAALRARVIAEVARDRFAPPKAIDTLLWIAGILDCVAADILDGPSETHGVAPKALEGLCSAEALALAHPAARFAPGFTLYVLSPLFGTPLPIPAPLRPVTRRLARREANILHRIVALNADREQSAKHPEEWLRLVMAAWREWVSLAGGVELDNARPDNRRCARP